MTTRIAFLLGSTVIQIFISIAFYVYRISHGMPEGKAAGMFYFAVLLGFAINALISLLIPNRRI